MEKENNLGDLIFEKIGTNGKYQITVLILLILISIISESYLIIITLMQTPPIFQTLKGEIVNLTPEMCDSIDKYILRKDLSKDTWVLDYGIFCSRLQISLLGSSFCFGAIIGSLSTTFIKYIGHKKSCIIYCFIIILGSLSLIIKNYYLLIFSNVCFGISNIGMIIIRNTIITEFSNKSNRSFFMNFSYLPAVLANIIYYSIFDFNIKWKLIIGVTMCVLIVFMIPFQYFYVENPRFFLMKKQEKKLLESMTKISKLNNKEETQESLLHFLNSYSLNPKESVTEFAGNNEDKQNHSIKFTLVFLIIIFFIFVIQNMSVTFELKFYNSEISVFMYNASIIIQFVSIFLISFLMNLSFLGRKHTIALILLAVIILRFLKTLLKYQSYLFLIIRICLQSSQMPIHTLITESFPTKFRVTYYGYIYFVGKIAALTTPFILEYLSFRTFDYVMIFCAISQIILSYISLKETLNSSLKD